MTHDLDSWTTVGNETCHDLYRIKPGVHVERAFQELSALLSMVRHLTQQADKNDDPVALEAARYLSALARALGTDIESGKALRDATQ